MAGIYLYFWIYELDILHLYMNICKEQIKYICQGKFDKYILLLYDKKYAIMDVLAFVRAVYG